MSSKSSLSIRLTLRREELLDGMLDVHGTFLEVYDPWDVIGFKNSYEQENRRRVMTILGIDLPVDRPCDCPWLTAAEVLTP